MKHIAILIAAILLASCSTTELPAVDTKTSATASADTISPPGGVHAQHTAARSANRIDADSFGIPFRELLSRFAHDSTKESSGYVWALKAGKPLLGMSDKNDLRDKKVRLIYLVSPDIQVGNGVHAGMTIKALLQKYPGLELDIGYNNDEIFSISVIAGPGKEMDVLAVVHSEDGSRLASHDAAHDAGRSLYPTRRFSTAGHIDHLLIFAPSPSN